MKIIVFGGSGFLGSHVADALSEAGHGVVVFDIVASPYLQPSQTMIVGSILDEQKIADAVRGCDVVYNFAGVADLNDAVKDPLNAVRTNILGNTIILEAARQARVKRFVFASSLYVYSKSGSLYRSTKQSCELIIENYFEEFGLPYTILRYGSLYGPRADDRNFIHKIVKQALTEGKITREGDGDEVREYIHVHDAARSSVDTLEEEFKNQYVVIAGSQQMKVRDLLHMIREMLDNKITVEYLPPPPTHSLHYEITPYTFAPKIAKRILRRTYLDLGQGILDAIQNAYAAGHPHPRYDGLVVDDDQSAPNQGKS